MTISRRTAIGQIAARAALVPLGGSLLMSRSALAARSPTPFTDIGPFYPMVKPVDQDSDLTMIGNGKRAEGKVIEIAGRLLDGRGAPVARSRVEIWQANAAGKYAHAGDTSSVALDPRFQGFGAVTTDAKGNYRFVTIKPGAYRIMPGAFGVAEGAVRPPHIHLDVAGRNDRLITQMLFPGDPLNDKDVVLAHVDRSLLIATDRGQAASGAQRFEWDIILANG
jgi:protocatechuate 3,4-dioxygenase beta subunit